MFLHILLLLLGVVSHLFGDQLNEHLILCLDFSHLPHIHETTALLIIVVVD